MLAWLWLTPIVIVGLVLARRRFRRRARRAALRAVKQHRIRVNRFQLLKKAIVAESLLEDASVRAAAERYAADNGVSVQTAMERVESYLDEIVPSFNVLSYYRFGRSLAGGLLRFLYQLSLEPPPGVEAGTQRIYVANHRSNVDYVLVAYALLGHVSISYAVGEWARVWPLENLFKSFGSYFLRRGHREALYHTVLESYVRLITREGVTQGIFLEGGLSRDGSLRPPKIGLLDHIVRTAAEGDFPRDVVFVPVGINYDRVLEDRVLVREHLGFEVKLGRIARYRRTTRFLLREMWRAFRGERERFGTAAIHFGEPISLRRWLDTRGALVGVAIDGPFAARKPLLEELARTLMDRIGRSVPVTPVTFCARLLLGEDSDLDEEKLALAAASLRRHLEDEGASFAGKLPALELLSQGLRALESRRLVESEEGSARIAPGEAPMVDYYARSLDPFAPPPIPDRDERPPGEPRSFGL